MYQAEFYKPLQQQEPQAPSHVSIHNKFKWFDQYLNTFSQQSLKCSLHQETFESKQSSVLDLYAVQ